jgi:hypothetical protein
MRRKNMRIHFSFHIQKRGLIRLRKSLEKHGYIVIIDYISPYEAGLYAEREIENINMGEKEIYKMFHIFINLFKKPIIYYVNAYIIDTSKGEKEVLLYRRLYPEDSFSEGWDYLA